MPMFRSLWKLWPSFRYAFRVRKPLLLGRLAWGVSATKLLRKSRLRYVDIALDFACNMRCAHCFATALTPKPPVPPVMTEEDLRRICREAMQMGALNFSFQGGEPLLVEDVLQRIACFRPSLNVISLTTNGSLVTPTSVRRLKQAGVDILTISLDSADPCEHDTFRGFPGAHARALEAVEEALRHGLHVTVGTTVSHMNVRSRGIRDLVRWAESKKLVLVFNLAVPIGNWADAEDVLLDEEDMAVIRSWVSNNQYIRTDFEANLGGWGCGAVKEILYITPYGDVLPCPFIHVSLGNIRNESLCDIRNRGLAVPEFAVYHQKCLCAQDTDFINTYVRATARYGLLEGAAVFKQTKS